MIVILHVAACIIIAGLALVMLWVTVAFATFTGMALNEWHAYPKGSVMRRHWGHDAIADVAITLGALLASLGLIHLCVTLARVEW